MDIPLTPQPVFAGVSTPVSPDVRSNRDPATGRMYILVLDDANIEPAHARRSSVRRASSSSNISARAISVSPYERNHGCLAGLHRAIPGASRIYRQVRRPARRVGRAETSEQFYEVRLSLEIDPPPMKPEDIDTLAAQVQNSRKQTFGTTRNPRSTSGTSNELSARPTCSAR